MPSKSSDNFDGLRLLAALLVIFSHEFAFTGRVEPTILPLHTFGNLGVLMFFSISGALVTESWMRDPNVLRFAVRRMLRVTPALAVAVFSMLIVVKWWLGMDGFPAPHPLLNGALWTIPLETEWYVILAAAGLLLARPSIPLHVLALALALYLGRDYLVTGYLLSFGLCFTAGALLYQHPAALLRPVVVVPVVLFGLLLALAQHTDVGLSFIVPVLTILAGRRSWPVLRDASRFGDLSYGVYLYGWPVQQLVIVWLGATTPYPVLMIPTVAMSLILAFASWHLVELPALRLKPSRQQSGTFTRWIWTAPEASARASQVR